MFLFIANSLLLGVGLTMDAFSVSMANGLNEKNLPKRKTFLIAGTFAFFQALMPMLGWVCVHTIIETFSSFEKAIPYIALVLLAFLGIKMIADAVGKTEEDKIALSFGGLLVQGVATGIDALSVGFPIAEYNFLKALVCSLIISSVTFSLCVVGVVIGKKFGDKLKNKASILGGIILILIGIEIFLTGIL